MLTGWTNVFSGGFNGEDSIPVDFQSSIQPPLQLLRSVEFTLKRWGWWERTRSCQNRKYGGKQLSTAYTSRHVFITHRITVGNSTWRLKIPKPRHLSEAAYSAPTYARLCCLRVCSDGKGKAEPSSVNIINVFLVLLTFPGSVQFLF